MCAECTLEWLYTSQQCSYRESGLRVETVSEASSLHLCLWTNRKLKSKGKNDGKRSMRYEEGMMYEGVRMRVRVLGYEDMRMRV